MPYVSTMEIYQDGLQKGYGTPMFNCINYEMIRWAIEAAEEVGMPVLIGHFYGFETNMDPAVAEMVTKYYASKVKVPRRVPPGPLPHGRDLHQPHEALRLRDDRRLALRL